MLYSLAKAFFWFVLRVVFRTQITGRERVPGTGPLLVVSNHISFADPPLIGVALPRHVAFMAMIELFRHPVLAWFVKAVGCIPVDRSKVEYTGTREAIRRLRAGACVGIFPEGGIRLTEKSVLGGNPDLRQGLEVIALLSHAAILPVVIRDARVTYQWRNWFRRPTIRVTLGYPFCLWKPKSAHRTDELHDVVRAELLKTVALN